MARWVRWAEGDRKRSGAGWAIHPSSDRVPAGATALLLSACLRSGGCRPEVARSMTDASNHGPRAERPDRGGATARRGRPGANRATSRPVRTCRAGRGDERGAQPRCRNGRPEPAGGDRPVGVRSRAGPCPRAPGDRTRLSRHVPAAQWPKRASWAGLVPAPGRWATGSSRDRLAEPPGGGVAPAPRLSRVARPAPSIPSQAPPGPPRRARSPARVARPTRGWWETPRPTRPAPWPARAASRAG